MTVLDGWGLGYTGLDDGEDEPSLLRASDGGAFVLDVDPWHSDATPGERRLLDRATGTVLDVGCGPGRLLAALGDRPATALGIDVSPLAVATARRRGLAVLRQSVFDPLPGGWGTLVLLDGTIGIGGDPEALLRRVADLLSPAGTALVELAPPGRGRRVVDLRLERGSVIGPWFPWAEVDVEQLTELAAGNGELEVDDVWEDEGRCFAALGRRTFCEHQVTLRVVGRDPGKARAHGQVGRQGGADHGRRFGHRAGDGGGVRRGGG